MYCHSKCEHTEYDSLQFKKFSVMWLLHILIMGQKQLENVANLAKKRKILKRLTKNLTWYEKTKNIFATDIEENVLSVSFQYMYNSGLQHPLSHGPASIHSASLSWSWCWWQHPLCHSLNVSIYWLSTLLRRIWAYLFMSTCGRSINIFHANTSGQ